MLELTEAEKSELMEHEKQHQQAEWLLVFAFFLTCCFYTMFAISLYLGDPMTWPGYFESQESMYGFFIIAFISFLLSVFLAWVKHFIYVNIGIYGSMAVAVLICVGFGIFAEMFTASANQDSKSKIKLENDAAYQATIKATSGVNNGADYGSVFMADRIAKAQQNYNRCLKRMEVGKEKHCDGDKGRLDSLKRSEANILNSQAAATEKAFKINFERQDQLKADSHNPIITAVSKIITPPGQNWIDYVTWGIVIIMMIVSTCFEYFHHYVSTGKKLARDGIRRIKYGIVEQSNKHGFWSRVKESFATGAEQFADDVAQRSGRMAAEINTASYPGSCLHSGKSKTRPALVDSGSDSFQCSLSTETAKPVDRPQTERQKSAPALSTAGQTVSGSQTAAEAVADPDNLRVLRDVVANPKFSPAFIAVATGNLTTNKPGAVSQSAIRKQFQVGAEMSKWVLFILAACGIVSEDRKRLLNKLSASDAQIALTEIKREIMGE